MFTIVSPIHDSNHNNVQYNLCKLLHEIILTFNSNPFYRLEIGAIYLTDSNEDYHNIWFGEEVPSHIDTTVFIESLMKRLITKMHNNKISIKDMVSVDIHIFIHTK